MVDGVIARKGSIQPDDAGIEGGRTMARCMASNHPKEAEAVLAATDVASFETAFRRAKRSFESCLRMVEVYGDTAAIDMRFDNNTLRNLVAEARFRREGTTRLAPTKYEPLAPGSEWITDDPAARSTLQVADCLTAREPDAVANILTSVPASPAETTALSALMPHVAGCLDRNIRLSLKKLGLRLALASAYDSRVRQPALSTGTR